MLGDLLADFFSDLLGFGPSGPFRVRPGYIECALIGRDTRFGAKRLKQWRRGDATLEVGAIHFSPYVFLSFRRRGTPTVLSVRSVADGFRSPAGFERTRHDKNWMILQVETATGPVEWAVRPSSYFWAVAQVAPHRGSYKSLAYADAAAESFTTTGEV